MLSTVLVMLETSMNCFYLCRKLWCLQSCATDLRKLPYRLQNKLLCIIKYRFSLKINTESSEVLGDVLLKYESSHICTSEADKHFTSLSKTDLPHFAKPFLPNVNVKFEFKCQETFKSMEMPYMDNSTVSMTDDCQLC